MAEARSQRKAQEGTRAPVEGKLKAGGNGHNEESPLEVHRCPGIRPPDEIGRAPEKTRRGSCTGDGVGATLWERP